MAPFFMPEALSAGFTLARRAILLSWAALRIGAEASMSEDNSACLNIPLVASFTNVLPSAACQNEQNSSPRSSTFTSLPSVSLTVFQIPLLAGTASTNDDINASEIVEINFFMFSNYEFAAKLMFL